MHTTSWRAIYTVFHKKRRDTSAVEVKYCTQVPSSFICRHPYMSVKSVNLTQSSGVVASVPTAGPTFDGGF